MRWLKFCLVAGLLLAITTTAGKAVTFVFDPDDLIQLYPASAGYSDVQGENKATQPNARRIHQPWGTVYETFYNPANPQPQPQSYNTYMNWRDSLGPGEGISAFNIWMLDESGARSWGEKVVWNPNGPKPTATADAEGKWNVEVIENPWGPGWLVQWWTDNPDYYINTQSDIGEFSFSGIAYWDIDENGYDEGDPEVQIGETCRIWFGALNYTESDGAGGWIYDWALHFDDQGWGSRTPNAGGPWSAGLLDSKGYGSGYEGVLELTAVPEPLTMFGVLIGIGGLAGYLRKRRITR